jgi:hypothetical protein
MARSGGRGRAARLALVLLFVLLGCRVLQGLESEVRRLLQVPAGVRGSAASSETRQRYAATLGSGLGWLELVRPHLRPGLPLLIVHDGADATIRTAGQLKALLFPLTVHTVVWPSDLPEPGTLPPREVQVAHLGPEGALVPSLEDAGMQPLVRQADFQFLVPPADAGPFTAAAGTLPAPESVLAASADAERLGGLPLLTLLALPLLLGMLVLRALGIRAREDPLAFGGWAWMSGCLLLALFLLAWMLAGLAPAALSSRTLVPACGVLGVVLAWLTLRDRRAARGRDGARSSAREAPGVPAAGGRASWCVFALCLGAALLLVLDRILLASMELVVIGDEAIIWAAKAKALWFGDGINARFAALASGEVGVVHANYPLLDPLLQLFSFQLAGRPLHFENRLPLQLCVPALLLATAGALVRHVPPWVAGLLVLLLATTRPATDACGSASADVLVALGVLCALDAGARWRATGERRWLALSALALTFLAASKNEGLMLALLAAGVLVVARRDRLRAAAGWLLLPLLVAGIGVALNAHFGFANDLLEDDDTVSVGARLAANAVERIGPVLLRMGDYVVAGGIETHLCFAAWLALLLLSPRALAVPGRVVPRGVDLGAWSAVFLAVLAVYALTYVSRPGTWEQHLRNSMPRLLFQLLPALLVWLAAAGRWLAEPPMAEPVGQPAGRPAPAPPSAA